MTVIKVILMLVAMAPISSFAKSPPNSTLPRSISLAIDSWNNILTRQLYWNLVKDSNIQYICFSGDELEGEAGCVCRGPKMYGTPDSASDELFKFQDFPYDDQLLEEALEEQAKKYCKPAGAIFG